MGKAKVTARTIATVKKTPIKAGRTMPKNIGGVANAKVVATVRKVKGSRNG